MKKTKIAILHQDLEWVEKTFQQIFTKKGFQTDLFDVRNTSFDDLKNYNLVLNRVYASVANRNFSDNLKTLDFLTELESNGINCLNSEQTSRADYSKFYSDSLMKKNGVPTPETLFLGSLDDISKAKDFSEKYSYPVVVKRDIGGRGKDVLKVNSEQELSSLLTSVFSESYLKDYAGGWVVQEFIDNVKGFDCRIAIVDDSFSSCYGRSLIPTQEGDVNWMASISNGSKILDYVPSEHELNIAIAATKSICALFNEVDLAFDSSGNPVIIENNPTPNYAPEQVDLIEMAADKIIFKYFNGTGDLK